MVRPLAVQLYSVREFAKKDFAGVLKKVADIGYKAVEPAGFWNFSPAEFKKIIADLGLAMYSSHSPWARSVNDVNEISDMLGILGLDTVVCGYGPADFKDLDAIKRTADNTNAMQAAFAKAGITLFQHNHAFEFERLNGRLKYQIYAELCPNVKFQIDSFWSTNLGTEDAVEMLKLFAARTILLHIKDGMLWQKETEQKYVNGILDRKIDLRPLGQGELPIKELVEAMPKTVGSIIVELDYCKVEMWQALEESYKFMTSSGFACGNK